MLALSVMHPSVRKSQCSLLTVGLKPFRLPLNRIIQFVFVNSRTERTMNIEINPETERLVRQEISNGHFRSIDELIVNSLHAWREMNVASRPPGNAGEAATARQQAGERIRELRKGVRLDRPKGMSLREYAHIGHKY